MAKTLSTRQHTLVAEYTETVHGMSVTNIVKLPFNMNPNTRIATFGLTEQAVIDLAVLLKKHGVNIKLI